MSEFWDAMERYNVAFGEYFPTEEFYGSEKEMVALMDECVSSGEPYELPEDDGEIR